MSDTPTHNVEVIDVTSRTFGHSAIWQIEVRRLGAYFISGDPVPNVNDVPKDIRDALLKWLLGPGPSLVLHGETHWTIALGGGITSQEAIAMLETPRGDQ